MTVYQLTDRRHDGRVVRVQADHIAATVAAWLADLDARSSLVELPSRAVRDGERNATVWLTAAASNGPPTCCFTRRRSSNRTYVHRLASTASISRHVAVSWGSSTVHC